MDMTFEMNNVRRDSDIALTNEIKPNSPIVEIFSALTDGKDTSKYGKKTDAVVNRLKELGAGIANGDHKSLAELNTIRRYSVEPLLTAEIQNLAVFGDFEALGYDESIEVESWKFIGDKSREQALNADVIFPAIKGDKYAVGTKTISGGWATDYRRLMLGDMSKENEGKNQVRIDIINKMKKTIVTNAYNAVKNATPVKYFFEGAGLTKAGVDDVLKKVRRLGTGATVIGDYALLQQFTPWAGYNSEFVYNSSRYGYTQGISAEDLRDIRTKGILGAYNGTILAEMANPYDYSSLNATGDNFDTMLDAGLAMVVPTGGQYGSPIKSWTRGGLTTFSGNDVTTGHVLTRMDIEFATDVTKGREFQIGMLSDTNL
nr:MAG TPA: hypothetical protein [Caudoviricetes sp.]